jgi:hypothetical protein
MKEYIITFLLVSIFGVSTTSEATLFDRGEGLIYDDYFDITWLQDINYSQTSGDDDDGNMSWNEAMNWVDKLEYKGFSNWRLPDAHNQDGSGPETGQEVKYSEIGHLYFIDLDNPVGLPLQNSGPFVGLASNVLWYGTEETSAIAYAFRTTDGDTMTATKDTEFTAWAVHDGDIGFVPIPEPATIMLLSSGLIGLAGLGRKKFLKN